MQFQPYLINVRRAETFVPFTYLDLAGLHGSPGTVLLVDWIHKPWDGDARGITALECEFSPWGGGTI